MIENYSQLKDGKKKRSIWFWLKVLFSVDNKHD